MEIKNTYKSKIFEKRIGSDILYASIDNNTTQTDTIAKNVGERFVQFYFCLKGNVTFHFSNNYNKVLEKNQSFLIYNPEKSLPLQLSVSSKSQLHLMMVSVTELHHFFHSKVEDSFLYDTKKVVYEEHSVSNDMKNIFFQLSHIKLNKAFEDLYFQTKISELILLYFSARQMEESTCPYLSNEELANKISKGKEILLQDLSKNYKISDLAKEINISEYKLKEGFKKIYGNTITQFVLEKKLELGKDELEKNQKKVKEIARELGYENPSHFIDAFKKKYGITPKQYEKVRA